MERSNPCSNDCMQSSKMKKKLLFVTEHYCDGKPELGVTNSYHNLFGSFKHTFDIAAEWNFNIIHYDDFTLKGLHIDNFAQKIYDTTKPDVMICTLLGTERCNPTEKFFEVFKQAGCKIVFLWPDFGRDWTIRSATRFDRFIDLNVAIAGERNGNYPKTLWSWTPEDPAYFYYDGQEKDIDVLFLGTIHSPERAEYLKFLEQELKSGAGVELNIHIGGGQRQEKLSHEQYAELTRRAKIVINFPFSVAGNDQLKGRVFEATACKCLLMERKNKLTSEYFTPNVEYIEYINKEDLLHRIKTFLENPKEREQISQAGLTRYIQNWSHNKFWESVFKELERVTKK